MLSIIFTILKIIGVVLLLILLLLALILLVPIRYQFFLTKEQEEWPDAGVKVSWFMVLFHLQIEYINQSLIYKAKILGCQVAGNEPSFLKKKEEKEKKKDEKRKKKAGKAQDAKKKTANDSLSKKENTIVKSDKIQESTVSETDSKLEKVKPAEKSDKTKEKKDSKSREEQGEREKRQGKEGFGKRIKGKFEMLQGLVETGKEKYEEYHISTLVPFLKGVLIRLLKHILPKRLEGTLTLGFEDPAATGYVTAGFAVMYPVYGRSFTFSPDFQEKVFEANCKGRGRIRIIYILYLLVILLLNKDVREIIFD